MNLVLLALIWQGLLMVSWVLTASGQDDSARTHTTALAQVFNTGSLIDRPEQFRELQEHIESALGSDHRGLHVPIIYEKLEEIQQAIIVPLNSIDVQIMDTLTQENNPDKILVVSLTLPDGSKQRIITAHTPRDLLSRSHETLEAPLIAMLVKPFEGLGPERRKILSAFIRSLHNSSIVISKDGVDIDFEQLIELMSDTGKPSARALARFTAHILSNKLEEYLRIRLDESVANPLIAYNSWGDFVGPHGISLVDETVSYMLVTELIDRYLNEARESLSQLLSKGEHKVAGVVEKANKLLVGASLGLTVAPGENGAAGHITLTYQPTSSIQFGAVAAGLLGSTSGDSSNALVALQGRVATGRFEVPVVASYYLGDGGFEFGIGPSYQIGGLLGSGPLAMTLGLYYLLPTATSDTADTRGNAVYTLTLSARLIEHSSVSLTGGIFWDMAIGGRPRFFVQTSLPFSPRF